MQISLKTFASIFRSILLSVVFKDTEIPNNQIKPQNHNISAPHAKFNLILLLSTEIFSTKIFGTDC